MRIHRRWGFTLIELMMVVVIVGLLASLATTSYRDYVVRAELSQQMVDIGTLRTVLAADGRADLERGGRLGSVPPALASQMTDTQFRGKEDLALQLVHWPAALAAAAGTDYAMVAHQPQGSSSRRLALFYRELETAGFQRRAWLAPNAFVFALDVKSGPAGGPSAPQPVPGGAGGLPTAVNPVGTAGASAPLATPVRQPTPAASALPPLPAASSPRPAVQALQAPLTTVQPPAGGGGVPQGPNPGSGAAQLPPPGGASGAGTASAVNDACPTGTSSGHGHGNSVRCTPPRGQPCPAGWQPVGHSGTCRRP